jgi:hypothetical protein
LAASNVSSSSLSMASAAGRRSLWPARPDQNPSSAPPSLPLSLSCVWRGAGGRRREKRGWTWGEGRPL